MVFLFNHASWSSQRAQWSSTRPTDGYGTLRSTAPDLDSPVSHVADPTGPSARLRPRRLCAVELEARDEIVPGAGGRAAGACFRAPPPAFHASRIASPLLCRCTFAPSCYRRHAHGGPAAAYLGGGRLSRYGLRASEGDGVVLPCRAASAATTSPPPPLIYYNRRGHGGVGDERG